MKHEVKLLNNHVLIIENDDDAQSPNTWGNTDVFLVYDHRSFTVEREGFKPRDIYDYLQKDVASVLKDLSEYDKYFIFTVYAYIHSGVSLSLGRGSDRFDTSSTGFILVDKSELGEDVTKEAALLRAEGVLDCWNTYLREDVYRFELIELIPYKKAYLTEDSMQEITGEFSETVYYDRNFIDSCSGFYGSDHTEILENIDSNLWNDEIKEQVKKL